MITFGDHVNPIIVKEIRQATRSRTLIVLVVLTLLACVLIALHAVAKHRGFGDPTPARDVFFSLYFCMSVVGFLAVPFAAHRSLAREQDDGAWELLTLTGLGPRRILLGKLASTLVQGSFFTLLVTPFMLLSHFLGGVSLANMIGLAIYSAALTGVLSVWTLFTAAIPTTRAQRTGTQIVTLISLCFALGIGFTWAQELVKDNVFEGVPIDGELGRVLLTVVSALLCVCAILFEAAVSRVSLATERYARGPRIAMAGGAVGLMLFGFWRNRVLADGDVPREFAILSALLGFAAALGFAADGNRARGRGAAEPAIFRTGAVWGLRFTVGFLVVPTLFWLGLSSPDHHGAAAIVAAPAYVLIYMSATLLLCRGLPFRRLAAPDVVRGVAVILVLFCSILPAAIFELSHSAEHWWAALPSPTLALGSGDLTPTAAAVLVIVALALTVVTDRVLVARARGGRDTAPSTRTGAR